MSGGDVTQSIQWRCLDMRRHYGDEPLPKPCADCYSLRVTAERLPYQPDVRWHPISPPVPVLADLGPAVGGLEQ